MRSRPLIRTVSHATLARVLPLLACSLLQTEAAAQIKASLGYVLLAAILLVAVAIFVIRACKPQLWPRSYDFLEWTVRAFMTETFPLCLLISILAHPLLQYRPWIEACALGFFIFNVIKVVQDYFPGVAAKASALFRLPLRRSVQPLSGGNCGPAEASGVQLDYYRTIASSLDRYEQSGAKDVKAVKIGICNALQSYLYYLAGQCQSLDDRVAIYRLMPPAENANLDQAICSMLSVDRRLIALSQKTDPYYNLATVTEAIAQSLQNSRR